VLEGDRRLADTDGIDKEVPSSSCFGILTKADIREKFRGEPGDVHTLVITPRPTEIDKDSIDLRLGSCFFVPKAHRSPCFIPGLTNTFHLYSEHYVPYGSYLVVPAHHTVLGSTLEYIKLPSDVSGQILTKSSWARTFITIETAPWIHPLYRGCLTLEITNVSNTPIVLYPGITVAQLVLLRTMRDTVDDDKDRIEGTYIGPVRPEPADLKSPHEALGHMRIDRKDMRYPFDEYFKRKELRERAVDHCSQYDEFCKMATYYLRQHGYEIREPG